MSNIDWLDLLQRRGVPHVTQGSSVKHGNVYVECPWCRNGKMLMGINLETGAWGCWKRSDHRGPAGNPRLLQDLLGISRDDAREIIGTRVVDRSIAALQAQLAGVRHASQVPRFRPQPPPILPEIELPFEFFALRERGRRSRPFVDYLRQRGLPFAAVARYGLHGCDSSERESYPHRIYLPLYQGNRIVGFTGRTVLSVEDEPQRYETMPPQAPAFLLGLSQLARGGEVLVVVEGPFDALKLEWAAHTAGLPVSVVCLMGSASTRHKNRELRALAKRYRRVVVLLDRGAEDSARELQRNCPTEVHVRNLPAGVDDPGDFTLDAATATLRAFLG